MHRLVLDDGQVVTRPDGPDRHRGDLSAPPRRRLRALGRGGDLLLLHHGACPIVPGRPGRRGGRGELGRPGGDVPRRPHRRGHAPAARGGPPQEHVGLPRPPDRAAREDRGHPPRRGRRRRGRTGRSPGSGSATCGRAAPATSTARRCSSSSAPSRGPTGCRTSIAVDAKGFILTGADAAQSELWPLTDREPCTVETTCPGVFAAGDVRSNTTKRVAFAVGDGGPGRHLRHRVLAEL